MPTMKEEEMMLRQGAEELSNKQDEYLSGASPKGKFSAQKVNALLGALDKVVALFGGEVAPTPRVKDTIKSFPPEVVAKLFAVMEALKDFDGEGDYEMPEPSSLATDDDLVVVMMVLDKLFKDKKFRKFLKKPVEMEMEMGGGEEEGKGMGGPSVSPEQETELSIMFGED
jgi:hypothetical protein